MNEVKTMRVCTNRPGRKMSETTGRVPLRACAATFAAALMAAAPAQAASVSYFLDQSNRLPDGPDYLKVTIDDEGAIAGAIDFRVETLAPLSDLASCKFGIEKFGFNGVELDKSNISGLPDGWKLKNDKKMDGFGRFENVLFGKKWNPHGPLTFSIVGIEGDTIYSYANSHDEGDGVFFSAYVGGLKRPGRGEDHREHDEGCGGCATKGAYFGGGSGGGSGGEPAAVPLPAAAWLLGSSLLGLIGIARRGIGSST